MASSDQFNPTNAYAVRASYTGLYNPYGRIVEGNLRNSYGPFIDPEIMRQPHLREQSFNLQPGKRRRQSQYGGFGYPS